MITEYCFIFVENIRKDLKKFIAGNKYNFIYPISGFSLSLFFILYYFFIYSSKQVQQYPLLLSYSC